LNSVVKFFFTTAAEVTNRVGNEKVISKLGLISWKKFVFLPPKLKTKNMSG
jgi:hypothetical protein